jgi:hypothetical protein
MPIPMTCACGRSLRIKDEFAGRRAKCPGCGTVLHVPLPEVNDEEEPLEVLPAEPPAAEAPPREAIRAEPPPPEPAPPRPSSPKRRNPRRDEPRDLPREERKRAPAVAFEEGWFGSINSGVVGGLLMIIIAVVWFVLGLMADRIFFYPPILLVIGLIAIIKGLFGGD